MRISNFKKILFKIIITFLVMLFLFLFVSSEFKETSEIELIFFDVGQGDACLINLRNRKNILIDGGPDNLVLRELGSKINFFDKKINFVVVSHFHEDHIVGLIEIFKRYKVDNLIYGEKFKEFYPAELLFLEARKQNTEIIEVKNEIFFSLEENCKIKIFNPASLTSSQPIDDNTSLISKLECHDLTLLSAGDNEEKIEEEVLGSGFDVSSEIFKASHHGSKTSNTNQFLDAVNPNIMIFSVGKDNSFKHPSVEVIERANNRGIELIRTDEAGTISIFAKIK